MEKSLTRQQLEMWFNVLDRKRYQEKNVDLLAEDPVCNVCKDLGGWSTVEGRFIRCPYCSGKEE